MNEPGSARRPARALTIGGLLALVATCWILLTPPGAGPDEPGHLTRSGAVIRGDLEGADLDSLSLEAYELPDSYAVPEPGCYAFQPTVAVGCAAPVDRSGATVTLASRADEYPLWGHLVYGLPTLLPGSAIWWARAFGAAIAVALLAGAIACAGIGRPLVGAGIVAATTPMAWSTLSIVNPSSFGTAGAIVLWVVLIDRDERRGASWLTAAAWAALALPRRDGLIWACTILAIALVAQRRSLAAWWRALGVGPQLVVGASTFATVVWGVTNDARVSRMVALSPLIVVAAEAWRRLWRRLDGRRTERIVVSCASVVVSGLATLGLLTFRPGGWDTGLARSVVGQTGTHLVEAVGVLGWLDTSLPTLAVASWFAAIGVLAALATATSPRLLFFAIAILAIATAASWVFELFQGNTSGRYWQGRYSLPLLAGIPIVMAAAPATDATARRVAWVAGGGALAIVNVAAWAAARRWGVGIDGSLAPWNWDTDLHPVPPIVLLAVHAAATAALAVAVFGPANQPQRVMPSSSIT